MGFTDKYNQLIIIIITFFLILSKFNNSAVVTNAPPSICNGKTHNVDDEAKNIYGLQCKNDGTDDCIVCFESSNIVISKNIKYDIYFLLHYHDYRSSSMQTLNIPTFVHDIANENDDRRTTIFACHLQAKNAGDFNYSHVSDIEINVIDSVNKMQIMKRKYVILYHGKKIGIPLIENKKQFLHLGSGTNIIKNKRSTEEWFNFDSLMGLGADWGQAGQLRTNENLIRWKISDTLAFIPSNSIDLIYMNTLLSVASFPQTIENFKSGNGTNSFYSRNTRADSAFKALFHEICKFTMCVLIAFFSTGILYPTVARTNSKFLILFIITHMCLDRVLKPNTGMFRIGDRTGRNFNYKLKGYIQDFFDMEYNMTLVEHGPASTSTNAADVFHLMTSECLECARKFLCPGLTPSLRPDHPVIVEKLNTYGWSSCWICHVEFFYKYDKPLKDVNEKNCIYYDISSDQSTYIFYGNTNMSYWAIEGVKGNDWKNIQPSSPNIRFDIMKWPCITEDEFIYGRKAGHSSDTEL